MGAFIALIVPMGGGGGGEPSHPIVLPPGAPPGIWPSPGHPAHPIAPGGPPVGIWPGPGVPTPPIYYPPGLPPGIWPSPGHPAHPIAPGGPPVGVWPPPAYPTHPIAPGGLPPGPSQGPGFARGSASGDLAGTWVPVAADLQPAVHAATAADPAERGAGLLGVDSFVWVGVGAVRGRVAARRERRRKRRDADSPDRTGG
jgi:hypothetical protein